MSIHIRVPGLVASAIIASAASAQTAVEWRISEGGNGHWYQGIVLSNEAVSWSTARTAAISRGGDLACLNSSTESNWVFDHVASSGVLWRLTFGPWLGGYQTHGANEPAGGWMWVDGTPIGTSVIWNPTQPDNFVNCGGDENRLNYWKGGSTVPVNRVNDMVESGLCMCCTNYENQNWTCSAILEWSADCNNDGIVDYGQIKSGQLADDNANGIPDICETSITGVLPPSVPAQGGSTITINGRNFPAQPSVLVGGVAATGVVRVSDSRLTAVTPALLPGMAPLTVNGYTLPDAIYIRPECGSDLDQNGTVDTADISIILLDFGPCYEPPAALAAPAPTPLLADEPSKKTTQR